MSYFKVQRIAKVSVDILSGFAVMGGSGQVTRAPAHPRTRAPAHPRTRAPAHPRNSAGGAFTRSKFGLARFGMAQARRFAHIGIDHQFNPQLK